MSECVVFIPGEHIDLTLKNIEQIKIYHKWVNNPIVRKYLSVEIPETLEVMKKEWFPNETDEKEIWFVIWHKEDQKPIGMVGFFKTNHIHRNAELGIFIGESEYWGRGIGVEAVNLIIDYGFDTLNLHKIVAGVNLDNKRSLRMCRTLGFVEEGHQKEIEFVDGKWRDIIWFGMLGKER